MELDTAPEMAARYRERIGRLTPAERLAQAVRLMPETIRWVQL